MKQQSTAKYWVGFFLVAVAIHLLLLLTVKQSFFSIFLKPISEETATERSSSFSPDAIITIPVTLEDEMREQPVERAEISDEAVEEIVPDTEPASGSVPDQAPDVDALMGDSQMPIRSPGSEQALLIPPRPLELAWPDTRGLKKCLGESIELNIRVSAAGSILEIEVADNSPPRECIEAAVAAARKIVFTPGRANGTPAEMWTQIRIDFRERH